MLLNNLKFKIQNLKFLWKLVLAASLTLAFTLTAYATGDLYVTKDSISLSKQNPLEGEEMTLYGTVYNEGDEDLRGIGQFIESATGQHIDADMPLSIVAGGSIKVFGKWKKLPYGDHTIVFRVIPWDKTKDNLKNNDTTLSLFIDRDTDNDGIPDKQDPDDDNDGFPDEKDAFPLDPSEWQDTDRDGMGDNKDTDDDNDGLTDEQEKTKGTDPKKADSDNDTFEDGIDAFPLDSKEWRDSDNDGIGDNADPDDDNDNVPDKMDAFPLDPNEAYDTDHDSMGDNSDLDDDNDNFPDYAEQKKGTDPKNPDTDGDGVLDGNDVFPLNPTEWADENHNNIGDNSDSTIPKKPAFDPDFPVIYPPQVRLDAVAFFDASLVSSSGSTITKWQWMQGNTLVGRSPMLYTSFYQTGPKLVVLTITDSDGKKVKKNFVVTVTNDTDWLGILFILLVLGAFGAGGYFLFRKFLTKHIEKYIKDLGGKR